QRLGAPAANERPAGHGQPGDASPDPDHGPPLLRRERRGEQGKAQGHHDRSAHALDRAAGDKDARAGSERAGGRGDGEKRQAGHVDAAPPDPVPQRRRRQDPRPERDRVSADGPLERPDAPAETLMDRRQRGDHHQRVEYHHEVRHRGEQDGEHLSGRRPPPGRRQGSGSVHVGHLAFPFVPSKVAVLTRARRTLPSRVARGAGCPDEDPRGAGHRVQARQPGPVSRPDEEPVKKTAPRGQTGRRVGAQFSPGPASISMDPRVRLEGAAMQGGVATTELLDRARAGDGEAFAQLVEPYRRELEVHCYRILGSVADAEAGWQAPLLSAWRALAGFEGRASVRPWLYRVATSRCLDALRSTARRNPVSTPEPAGDPPEPTRLGEVLWLEPYPDVLLEGI